MDLLAAHQPDLVLLDWMMPGMNGIEVLQNMRSTPEWSTVPVIMLTARAPQRAKVVRRP